MLELPGVTLVCIDGVHHELALAAIEQSLLRCRFGRALFVTDLDFRIEALEVLQRPAIRSPVERRRFILTELRQHVATSHVLVIAWDAFVINPAAWDDVFLTYDCVSAPPVAAVAPLVDEDGILLLSRRLLEAGGRKQICDAPAAAEAPAATLHTVLEADPGLRAAPRNVAERFAFGADYPSGRPFGFAGLHNMWMFFQPPDLRAFLAMAASDVLGSPALEALGINLQALGRNEEAVAVFRAMLSAHPVHDGARRALAAMQGPPVAGTSSPRSVLGRNDPCPCGSGQKYKQCHGRIGAAPQPSPPVASAVAALRPPMAAAAAAPQPSPLVASAGPASPAADARPAATADIAVLLHLARAAFDRNDRAGAEMLYGRVLKQRPDDPVALEYLGVIATHARSFDEAERLLVRALAVRPHAPEFHNNLGLLHQSRAEFSVAEAGYRRALALSPDYAPAWNNLGLALQEQGALDDAIGCFRAAIRNQADFAEAHWNLSLALLASGEFAEGFVEQEWRLEVARHRDWWTRRRLFPQWRGEPVAGKRVLILAEQGMGDMVQFVRYAEGLAARGAIVLLEAPADLADLMQSAPGVAGLVPRDGPYPPCDFQVPVMSLPLGFGTTTETMPAPAAYLSADPSLQARWRSLLGAQRLPRVGIAWAGNPEQVRDRFRSMPLSAFEPLLQLQDIEWISLQKGAAAGQIATLPPGCALREMSKESRNFADLAALIAELDLILTVDTAVVHVAGALGRPTLLFLDAASDWRWLRGRSDNLWYPTVRILRQSVRGDWSSVVATAAAELRRYFKT
ncbi:MAG: tetratricopeptide repeat protein [Betaproteobacteria bacterium]